MGFFLVSRALTLFGFASGAYRSFKALKREDVDEQRGLLMFWSVFACLFIFEQYAEAFVSWLPFFFEAKSVLLLVVVVPQLRLTPLLFEAGVLRLVEAGERRVLPRVLTGVSARVRGLIGGSFAAMLARLPASELAALEASMAGHLEVVQAEKERRSDCVAVVGGR